MSLALQAAAALAAIPFVGGSLYLGLLALVAILPARREEANTRGGEPSRRFAFVIPARNEAPRIAALIESIGAVDYPQNLVRALVVADNCSDDTAAIARAAGADVVERADRRLVGKGHALAFGLAHLSAPYDAVVFVDGDCTVNAGCLSAIAGKLDGGADAVQAYYVMAPERDARAAAVRSLALTLVHYVRPLAKERLHASAGLKGSGMCFTRKLIEDLGWSATGLAEDVEQHVRLLHTGHRVAFAREAIVTGAAPDTLADAGAQHRRWEAGRASAARRHGVRLLLEGLRTRSIARADAGVELLLPPLSVVVAGVLAVAALGAVMRWPWLVAASAVSVASLAGYVISGLWLQRLGARGTAQALLSMPRYALWKLRLYGSAVARPPAEWEPTRGGEDGPRG